VVSYSDNGSGPSIAQDSKCLGDRQTAFDAEIAAIEAVLRWHRSSRFRHLIMHSDSTSAIARAQHSGAGPGEQTALSIRLLLQDFKSSGGSAELVWVKGHDGNPRQRKSGHPRWTRSTDTGGIYSHVVGLPQT